MANICSVCGATIADGAKFCPGCGAPVKEAPVAEAAPVSQAAPVATATATSAPVTTSTAKKSFDFKNKNTWIGIGAIAIVVILLIVLIANLAGGGYKGAFKDYMKLRQQEFNSNYTSVEAYGKNIKVSYKIKNAAKCDKDDLKKIEKSLNRGNDKSDKDVKVSEAYEIKANITIKGKEDDKDIKNQKFSALKIDGKWYIESGSLGLSKDDDDDED